MLGKLTRYSPAFTGLIKCHSQKKYGHSEVELKFSSIRESNFPSFPYYCYFAFQFRIYNFVIQIKHWLLKNDSEKLQLKAGGGARFMALFKISLYQSKLIIFSLSCIKKFYYFFLFKTFSYFFQWVFKQGWALGRVFAGPGRLGNSGPELSPGCEMRKTGIWAWPRVEFWVPGSRNLGFLNQDKLCFESFNLIAYSKE